MRAGGRILMIFGVVLGIIAAVVTFIILQGAAGEEAGEGALLETQQVVIAFQTIEPWQEIPPDAVALTDYPQPIPADAVLAEMPSDVPPIVAGTEVTETVSGIDFVAGKISNTRIYPGQVIVTTQLVNKDLEEIRLGLGGKLSYIIPDGQVAVALNIDPISSVAGALQSGDQVDIIASYGIELLNLDTQETVEAGSITQFFMQKVQILRVGPWAVSEDEGGGPTGTVTILLEPQQALELKWITENTNWQFVLRSITDEQDFVTEPVDINFISEKYDLIP